MTSEFCLSTHPSDAWFAKKTNLPQITGKRSYARQISLHIIIYLPAEELHIERVEPESGNTKNMCVISPIVMLF